MLPDPSLAYEWGELKALQLAADAQVPAPGFSAWSALRERWLQDFEALDRLEHAPLPFTNSARRRLVERRRAKARSRVPLLRRPSRVGCGLWPEPSGSPDLISLYAALSRTTDEPAGPPR
jgi:hypothetical protein